MIDCTTVLESAEYISNNAKEVSIRKDLIKPCAEKLLNEMKSKKYSPSTWRTHKLHPKLQDASTVDWIFLIDLLNFSFWDDSDAEYMVKYDGECYTGYWSLCATVNRALDAGIPVTSPSWYANATDEQLENVFRSDKPKGKIPLLEERKRLIRESGNILLAKFNGSFTNVIDTANGDAIELLKIVCCNFHSFLDISTYEGRPVFLLKRAQILVADLWACFQGQSYGKLGNIDSITMFADYRIPQQLQALNIIIPSFEFERKMAMKEELNVHDPRIIELRGCSIWVVELLRRELVKLDPSSSYNAILLDFYLWDTVKENRHVLDRVPFHRTRSCFY